MNVGMTKVVVALASMTVFGSAQAAPIYDFSYRFKDGMVLSGSFAGKEDGNLIQIENDIQLYYNGVRMLEGVNFASEHFLIPELWFVLGGAVASFDGSANNFLFSFVDDYGYNRRVFQSIPQGFQGQVRWTVTGYPYDYHSDFIASENMHAQWVLTRRAVSNEIPEPASLALFTLGLISAYGAFRRKQ